ncbi:hypothetical protein V866_004066 [Kwoniella sp. B9012]
MWQVDLSFPLLSLLSKERAVYGLRNGDHERYRRHCTNKIHRLRQTTGQTCGKGKQYKAPPKLDIEAIKDIRHLQLLLFSAERALAHSHEIKSQLSKNTSTGSTGANGSHGPGSKKDQISWLRRSLKSSTELFDLINNLSEGTHDNVKINQRTKAEMTIYHLSVRSELSFEKSDFGACLTDLVVVRKLLMVLNENSKNSYDEALTNEFIDLKDPLIRFSAYKLGRSESHDITGIVNDLDNDTLQESLPGFDKLVQGLKKELELDSNDIQKDRIKLDDTTFAGEKIEFRNPELVKIMASVQEVLNKFESKKSNKKNNKTSLKGWDKVLTVLGEAEVIARRLKDDHEASGSSTSLRSTQITSSLNLAHAYIVHLLLSHRIKRDLSLIDALSSNLNGTIPSNVGDIKIKGGKIKIEEVVKGLGGIIKLLDTVLQSLRGIAELSIVQEKEGVRVGVEGLEGYYHALKCFQLARLHCLHPTPSYSSAISLLERSVVSLRQSRSLLVDPPIEIEESIITIPKESIDSLEDDLHKLDIASKKGLFSQSIEKPVFFDMAFNYVDIPFDELEVLSGKKEKQSAGSAVTDNLAMAKDKTVEGLKKLGRETRETTPAVEFRPSPSASVSKTKDDEAEEEEEGSRGQGGEGNKKGWLGGWFGRGK